MFILAMTHKQSSFESKFCGNGLCVLFASWIVLSHTADIKHESSDLSISPSVFYFLFCMNESNEVAANGQKMAIMFTFEKIIVFWVLKIGDEYNKTE